MGPVSCVVMCMAVIGCLKGCLVGELVVCVQYASLGLLHEVHGGCMCKYIWNSALLGQNYLCLLQYFSA